MTTWLCPRGPEDIAERIRVMLALVELGRAEVVPPAGPPSHPKYRAWPELDPGEITATLVQNGQAEGFVVEGALEIECIACQRRYRQSWVPERGCEEWTVTCAPGAVPGPPAG
jgi:hypothetical protein